MHIDITCIQFDLLWYDSISICTAPRNKLARPIILKRIRLELFIFFSLQKIVYPCLFGAFVELKNFHIMFCTANVPYEWNVDFSCSLFQFVMYIKLQKKESEDWFFPAPEISGK